MSHALSPQTPDPAPFPGFLICSVPSPNTSSCLCFLAAIMPEVVGREVPPKVCLSRDFGEPNCCLAPVLTLSHPSPVEVDPELEPESAEYLVALERATAALEQCVNLCKAHVMMVTCFDISVTATTTVPGPQEVDV